MNGSPKAIPIPRGVSPKAIPEGGTVREEDFNAHRGFKTPFARQLNNVLGSGPVKMVSLTASTSLKKNMKRVNQLLTDMSGRLYPNRVSYITQLTSDELQKIRKPNDKIISSQNGHTLIRLGKNMKRASTVVVNSQGSAPRAIPLDLAPERIGIYDPETERVHHFNMIKGDRTPHNLLEKVNETNNESNNNDWTSNNQRTLKYRYNKGPISFTLNKLRRKIHVNHLYYQTSRTNNQIPGRVFFAGLKQLDPKEISLLNCSYMPNSGTPRCFSPNDSSKNYYGRFNFKPSYSDYALTNTNFDRSRQLFQALMGSEQLTDEKVIALLPSMSNSIRKGIKDSTGKQLKWAAAKDTLLKTLTPNVKIEELVTALTGSKKKTKEELRTLFPPSSARNRLIASIAIETGKQYTPAYARSVLTRILTPNIQYAFAINRKWKKNVSGAAYKGTKRPKPSSP